MVEGVPDVISAGAVTDIDVEEPLPKREEKNPPERERRWMSPHMIITTRIIEPTIAKILATIIELCGFAVVVCVSDIRFCYVRYPHMQ